MNLSRETLKRLYGEVKILKRLDHLNIVKAQNVPEGLNCSPMSNTPFICMEYCDGGDLRQVRVCVCVCGCVCVGRGGGSLREGGREGGKEGGKEAKWTGAREGGNGKRIEEEGGKRCGECLCTSLVGTVQYVVSVCVRH